MICEFFVAQLNSGLPSGNHYGWWFELGPETPRLGLQPGFPASARPWIDTGLTLQNQRFETTYDYAAPGRIVVGLCLEITTSTMVGLTGSAVANLLPNLLGIWEQIGRQSPSTSKPFAPRRFLPRLREG